MVRGSWARSGFGSESHSLRLVLLFVDDVVGFFSVLFVCAGMLGMGWNERSSLIALSGVMGWYVGVETVGGGSVRYVKVVCMYSVVWLV